MVVHVRSGRVRLALVAACAIAPALRAQQPAAPPTQVAPDTGAVAPDFSVPGATREGVMNKPIKLSDLRGQTVVLSFIVQARTRG